MTAPGEDELRVLRERAYGPAADIHDDPVALQRLRELEAAATAPTNAPDAAAAAASVPSPDPEVEEPPDPVPASPDPGEGEAAPTAADAAADEHPAPRARLPRRVVWLWAASVVVALVAGAGATMATSSAGAERVAVLAEADPSEWPTNMFGDPQEGARIFDAFEGIRVLIVPNAWGSPTSDIICLFVVRAEGEGAGEVSNEILTTGCGDAAFAPTASFTVSEGSPAALRDRFPVGTGVRVVIEGDEAHVFSRMP